MESYRFKQNTKEFSLSTGILKNDKTKRRFWKVCKVVELLPGRDGKIRAAKVEVVSDEGGGKKVFKRSLPFLIPLELSSYSEITEQSTSKTVRHRV